MDILICNNVNYCALFKPGCDMNADIDVDLTDAKRLLENANPDEVNNWIKLKFL